MSPNLLVVNSFMPFPANFLTHVLLCCHVGPMNFTVPLSSGFSIVPVENPNTFINSSRWQGWPEVFPLNKSHDMIHGWTWPVSSEKPNFNVPQEIRLMTTHPPRLLHFHFGRKASKFDPFKGKLGALLWKVSKFFGFRIIKQELSFQVGSLFSRYTKLIFRSKWNFAHIGNSLRLPSFRPCGRLSKYLHDSSLSDGKYFLYFHSIKFMVYITVKKSWQSSRFACFYAVNMRAEASCPISAKLIKLLFYCPINLRFLLD